MDSLSVMYLQQVIASYTAAYFKVRINLVSNIQSRLRKEKLSSKNKSYITYSKPWSSLTFTGLCMRTRSCIPVLKPSFTLMPCISSDKHKS